MKSYLKAVFQFPPKFNEFYNASESEKILEIYIEIILIIVPVLTIFQFLVKYYLSELIEGRKKSV